MYQFNILIYFIILGLAIRSLNIIAIFSALILGIILIALIPVYRKIKKQNIRFQIKNNPNSEIINVNKAAWWEFEELPTFQKVSAKKAVWIRNHNGRYTSKKDFIIKNNIKNEEKIIDLIYV